VAEPRADAGGLLEIPRIGMDVMGGLDDLVINE